MSEKSIFQRIIDGELPADKLYEDELCIVIADINPQAPVHVLVVPRQPIAKLSDADESHRSLLGHLLLVAGRVANQLGVGDAFRLVINNGAEAGQTVFHLHLHILAGRVFSEANTSN